jgi:hypothetical protein
MARVSTAACLTLMRCCAHATCTKWPAAHDSCITAADTSSSQQKQQEPSPTAAACTDITPARTMQLFIHDIYHARQDQLPNIHYTATPASTTLYSSMTWHRVCASVGPGTHLVLTACL